MPDKRSREENRQTGARAPFSENAIEVLRARYLQRDEAGQIVEDPDGMLARVARASAEPAQLFGEDQHFWEARFFDRMHRLEFLPNSPTLMNAGLPGGNSRPALYYPSRMISIRFLRH
jgi:ribonucleoside-diphosphate reductase alpha chain